MTNAEIALIARMERAPDFGYDDEAVALNESLARRGLTWYWSGSSVRICTFDEFEAMEDALK